MTTDALGGHIEMAIGSVAVMAPHVSGGKLRAVAVTGDRRSHAMPDVATLAEQGYPGFSALAWWGIFAPAATSRDVLARFHAELVKVLKQPDLRRQLTEQLGMDLAASDPATLRKFLISEMERWGKVVRQHAIRAD
jgi:tripartite-type tricarboxylate transporter receptor subunit TctC